MDYDKALINLLDGILCGISEKKIIEIAIGTGEPIAKSLVTKAYNLFGIDF